MMKTQKILPLLFGAFLLIAAFSACKKDLIPTDEALGLIPKQSTTVMRVDIPALMEKSDFESLRKSPMYLESVAKAGEDNPTLAKLMENPELSGVDLQKSIYIFVEVETENPREAFTGILMTLADADRFEELVRSEAEVTSKGAFNYAMGDGAAVVSWTKEYALFGISNANINLVEKAKAVLDTRKNESVASNKELQKAFAEAHDLSLWINTTPLSESPDIQMGLSLAEMDPDALKDNYISAYLDFLDGSIVGVANLDLTAKLTKDLNKIFNDQISTDFAKYLPNDQVALLMTHAINIRGIDEVLSARSQSKGFLEFAVKEYGLTTKDIRETFGGDIALAAIGQEGTDKKVGLFATSILDAKRLDTILALGVEKDYLEKERDNQYKMKVMRFGNSADFFQITFDDGAPRLLVKDNLLFVCGDEMWLEKLENGGFAKKDRLKGDLLDKSSKNLFYAFFDANTLRSMNREFHDNSVKNLDVQVSRKKAELNIRMNDENMNALKAMLKAAEERYEEEHRKIQ